MATYVTSNRSTSHRTRREVAVIFDRDYGELFIHDADFVFIDGQWITDTTKTIQLNFSDIVEVELRGYHNDGDDRFKIDLCTKEKSYHIPVDDLENMMDLYTMITREVDKYKEEGGE